MRLPIIVSSSVALLVVGSLGLIAAVQPNSPARVAPWKLKNHLGKRVTMCGRVVTHGCSDKDRATILDLEEPYWENGGAILITELVRRSFPPRLEDGYVLGNICGTGTVERREERYVVAVEKPDGIVVTKRPPRVPFSADAVRPCDEGVQLPAVTREVRANYTSAAIRAKQQGRVFLEAVVRPDGAVGEVRVLRGLPSLGLDEQAVSAVRQWRFKPGTVQGRPTAVIVPVELSFRLK